MSTWHYLECADHEPPLRSDVVAQHCREHTHELVAGLVALRPDVPDSWYNEMFYTDRTMTTLLPDTERGDAMHRYHAKEFLHLHPRCRIRLVTEYGDVEREWAAREEVDVG